MNTNPSSPTPEAPGQPIPSIWIRRKWAFLLGVFSFFLMFILGEALGDNDMIIGMGAYFLIAQYFLSRGHPQALRKDWPLILALNFTLLLATLFCLVFEPNKGAKLTTLCLSILAVACSYAGAALAARTAPK